MVWCSFLCNSTESYSEPSLKHYNKTFLLILLFAQLGSGYISDSRLIFITKSNAFLHFVFVFSTQNQIHSSILHLHFQINFFYFASWNTRFNFFSFYQLFIVFPPTPFVLLFLPNEQYGGLKKNSESVNKKWRQIQEMIWQ